MSGKRRKKRKKSGNRIIIFIICILLLVLAGAAFAVFMKNRIRYNQEHSASYQLEEAEKAKAEGDYQSAEEYYKKALSLDPEDLNILFGMTDLYSITENDAAAISAYQKILELDEQNKEAFSGLLSLFEKENDIDSILALKEKASDPDNAALFADYEISPPVFSPESGSYTDSVEVAITAETDMEIYYCMDGNDPSVDGTLYTGPISITDEGEHYFWAVTKNTKGMYSEAVSADYYLEISGPEMPTLSPDGGNFVYSTKVYVSIPENCNAYYTWDGSVPDKTSKKVQGKLKVPEGNHILSVIAIDKTTGKKSSVCSAVYAYYPDEITE